MPNARVAHALQRFGAALTIGIALGFAVARANAQAPDSTALSDSARLASLRTVDSLLAQVDSILARTKAVPTQWTMELHGDEGDRNAAAYAGILSVALVANTVLHIDRDPCPTGKRVCFATDYRDRIFAQDKLNHLNAAYFLTTAAISQGVPPLWAAGLTCGVAGVGFEYTQGGYISLKDIAADCTGAGLALALRKLRHEAQLAGWFR